MKVVDDSQLLLNMFMWNYNKLRIKTLFLQPPVGKGGLAYANIMLYY